MIVAAVPVLWATSMVASPSFRFLARPRALDGSIATHRRVALAVAGEESAALPALALSLSGRRAQSIGRLPQAAPLFLVLEPLDEIGDIFVVGFALVRSPHDEALEVFGEGWAVAAPVDEILTDEHFLATGVFSRQLPVLFSVL